MIELSQRSEHRDGVHIDAQLPLTYELRQKRWLRARLPSGEEVSVRLSRGEQLRGGDLFSSADGRVIEIVAAAEPVVQANFATPDELARAAYHLGNRHALTQIGAGFLRIQENHVLEAMLKNLGAILVHAQAPFEPEPGAYAGRHLHAEDESGAKIHEYSSDENVPAK